mmetsp:Transcript_7716/g.16058  ORF Transcript_7716/g.16058 Transcript_7716/m.16058 type:complete len:97 (+) Transcript_7716:185-475(+)
MTAADEAKHLDSVTDNFDNTSNELDESRVLKAMSALNAAKDGAAGGAAGGASKVKVSKEDIALVVSELEVTAEAAEKTIRECGGDIREALRSLIVS